jgi:hypothetical protein
MWIKANALAASLFHCAIVAWRAGLDELQRYGWNRPEPIEWDI